jgi:hypothetical protein
MNIIVVSTQATFNLSQILPLNQKLSYFRYEGSLTTPPCTQDIKWTVFEKTIQISQEQLNAFYTNVIPKNFRTLQRLRKRGVFTNTLYSSDSDREICNAASIVKASFIFYAIFLAYFI